MIDINKHRLLMAKILKEIFADMELANALGFKGGSALLFFHDLPRFSVDLDFNLIRADKEERVYEKMRKILLKYGKIHDEAQKFYGLLVVLDYGVAEQKLKVEISNRKFVDRYEIKNMLGINMNVMVVSDMFAHKLCALLDRKTIANRDIFDSWFFMNNQTALNKDLLEARMKKPFKDYLQDCIDRLDKMNDKGLLQGLGELMDDDIKKFVRTKLRSETIGLLKFYQKFPILA